MKKQATLVPVNEHFYNLENKGDFKDCLKHIIPSATNEVLELYTHGFRTQNKNLIDFLERRCLVDGNEGIKINLEVVQSGNKPKNVGEATSASKN